MMQQLLAVNFYGLRVWLQVFALSQVHSKLEPLDLHSQAMLGNKNNDWCVMSDPAN